MPRCFFTVALCSLLAIRSFAGDVVTFTTRDGQRFENVTVIRAEGRRLEVKSATGAQSVRYRVLPREIQERFFDPSMLYPPQVGDRLDFKTLDGHAYQGPLRQVLLAGISIETPHGVETIAFERLPPELANAFDHEPEDVARYEAALRAQKARALAAQQAAERKAAEYKAAQERAARDNASAVREPAMGERGARQLGDPQLGGRGSGR
jgi:hypothetical protein